MHVALGADVLVCLTTCVGYAAGRSLADARIGLSYGGLCLTQAIACRQATAPCHTQLDMQLMAHYYVMLFTHAVKATLPQIPYAHFAIVASRDYPVLLLMRKVDVSDRHQVSIRDIGCLLHASHIPNLERKLPYAPARDDRP